MVKALRAQGVSGRAAGQGALQISPSFVITEQQVADMAASFERALG